MLILILKLHLLLLALWLKPILWLLRELLVQLQTLYLILLQMQQAPPDATVQSAVVQKMAAAQCEVDAREAYKALQAKELLKKEREQRIKHERSRRACISRECTEWNNYANRVLDLSTKEQWYPPGSGEALRMHGCVAKLRAALYQLRAAEDAYAVITDAESLEKDQAFERSEAKRAEAIDAFRQLNNVVPRSTKKRFTVP